MSHAFISRRGGGAGLNFDVKAYSSALLFPASAKENTIGVITTDAMTGWTIQAAAPENPVEGMVWIANAISSDTSFNALKKNGAYLYPAACWQYTGGAWISKTVRVYLAGTWEEPVKYLYNAGDLCADISGGWTSGNDTYVATITNTATALKVSYGKSGVPTARTANKIDVSDYTVLHVLFSNNTSVADGNVRLMAHTNTVLTVNTAAAITQVAYDTPNEIIEITTDVSSLAGSYYLGLASYIQAAQIFYIHKMWLS